MMEEKINNEEKVAEEDEHAEAYNFWIYAFGIIGGIIGYNIGVEAGFSFWVSQGFAFIGLLVLAIIMYKFRKFIAIAEGIAIIDGIRSA